MKRRDLIAEIAAEAKRQNVEFVIEREGANHTIFRLASARQARVDADRIRAEAMESTRRTATRLAQRGFPLRDIGLLLGISFQRVQQLLQGAAATEEKLPRLDSNQQPAG